jgi:hypothetical protein
LFKSSFNLSNRLDNPTTSSSKYSTSKGNYLYVTNQYDNTISMYSISSNGSLVALSPYIVSTGGLNAPINITTSIINKSYYAYVTNNGAIVYSIYSISTNGQLNALTPINRSRPTYNVVIVNIPPVPFLSGDYLFTHMKYTH